jgi:3-hydroxyisobutyrate dehydrogenase
VLVGEAFGLKGATMVDILNVSTGRNTATELKMKQFVLSGTFASGFSLALMAKDLRTAAELAEQLGLTTEGVARMASLWAAARAGADEAADHTAIFSYLLDHSCGSGQRGCG